MGTAMRRAFGLCTIVTLLSSFFCSGIFAEKVVAEETNNALCFMPLTREARLEGGDVVTFENRNNNGSTWLTWCMEGYSPKLKLVTGKPGTADFFDEFTIKQFEDGTYGFYIVSPYVSMRYFICGFDGTQIGLQQENSRDANEYKWDVSRTSTGNVVITYANPTVKTAATLYLYGSPSDENPLFVPADAGDTGGLDWAVNKGMPCTVTYTKTADWGSGYQAHIRITNNGSTAIEDWILDFQFPYQITSMWDAQVLSYKDRHYQIKNLGWNGTIAPGESVSFGFRGVPGNTTVEPYNFVIVHQGG